MKKFPYNQTNRKAIGCIDSLSALYFHSFLTHQFTGRKILIRQQKGFSISPGVSIKKSGLL